LADVFTSIFVKADPLRNQCSHDISTSAFDAAIQKFKNCGGNLGDSVDDD
jgi:hypothetical protein